MTWSIFSCDSKSVAATFAFIVSTLMGVGAPDAYAEEHQRADRWTPSLSVNFAFGFHDVGGSISSSQVDPGTGAFIAPLRPFSDSQKLMTSPHVGGTLEIMSPASSFRFILQSNSE